MDFKISYLPICKTISKLLQCIKNISGKIVNQQARGKYMLLYKNRYQMLQLKILKVHVHNKSFT